MAHMSLNTVVYSCLLCVKLAAVFALRSIMIGNIIVILHIALIYERYFMYGARDFANLFVTGQYGRLYIVAGSHARGRTFRIFVLPEGEVGENNGPNNAPCNKDAVEVYGVVAGNPGWTETYGWLHTGKWRH